MLHLNAKLMALDYVLPCYLNFLLQIKKANFKYYLHHGNALISCV